MNNNGIPTTNNRTRRTNNTRRNRRRNRALRGVPRRRGNGSATTANYPLVSRDTQRVTLTYQDLSLSRAVSLLSSYFVYSMRLNGIYDPDPLLLTGSVTGFAEWGGFYRQYLVEAVTITWSVVNRENFPVIIVFAPSLTNLAAVLSSGQAVANLAENKFAQTRVLSAQGGQDRARIQVTIKLSSYVALPQQYNSGIYSGFMGAAPSNPSSLIYGNFGGYAPSTFTNGIVSDLKVRFHTKLYDVQTPLG